VEGYPHVFCSNPCKAVARFPENKFGGLKTSRPIKIRIAPQIVDNFAQGFNEQVNLGEF